MLWYKSWLETRFRLAFALALAVLLCFMFRSNGGPSTDQPLLAAAAMLAISATLSSVMLGAAGNATQSAMLATKSLHGSTLYTLSLPVSRFSLLAVRAGLGWLEMALGIGAACGGMWLVFPPMKAAVAPEELAANAIALMVCTTGPYCITVLLATFLDDTWRVFGSFISIGALWFLAMKSSLPASFNVFRAMTDHSPMVVHAMPWTAMAVSLVMAAILFLAALKIVRTREY